MLRQYFVKSLSIVGKSAAVLSFLCLPVFGQSDNFRVVKNLPDGKQFVEITFPDGHKERMLRQWTPSEYRWTTAPWTQGDSVFIAIGKECDAERKPFAAQFTERMKRAREKPSPATAYALAYVAAKGFSQKVWESSEGDSVIAQVGQILEGQDVPSKHYARTRFIVLSQGYANNRYISISKRLLAAYPNDNYLKYCTTRVLQGSRDKTDVSLSVQYCRDLLRREPNSSRYRFALADCLSYLWIRTKDRKYADEAVAEFNRYISLIPSNDPLQAWAKYRLQMLQKSVSEER